MASESAIIVPIDGVGPMVSSLRRQYDKSASLGVPAHITLLYPFQPPRAFSAEIETLAGLFSKVPAFTFSFTEVRRFPATVYLHPDKFERFIQITNTLLQQWPECKPYNGAFPDIVPHLTVASHDDTKVLDEVERRLAGLLPMACVAKEAWLLFSNEAGHWSKQVAFPFVVSSQQSASG
jgi:2'-5' RNA ligase